MLITNIAISAIKVTTIVRAMIHRVEFSVHRFHLHVAVVFVASVVTGGVYIVPLPSGEVVISCGVVVALSSESTLIKNKATKVICGVMENDFCMYMRT